MLPYQDAALSTEKRAADLLARMTVDEKLAQMRCLWPESVPDGVNQAGGITHWVRAKGLAPRDAASATNAVQRACMEQSRLGIPVIFSEEALCGLVVDGSTIFPDAIAQGSSWNPDLLRELGATVHRQMTAIGVRQTFGPLCDVARDPRWGRLEETFGEDPYLVGTLATAMSDGIQQGGRCHVVLKHFIAYGGSEGGRNLQNVPAGERELREVHGLPFEMAIRSGAKGAMSSYNAIDGEPVQASSKMLLDLLRGEYGFEGILVSDLGAVEHLHTRHGVSTGVEDDAVLALRAGLDWDLPGGSFNAALAKAIESGRVDESELDRAVSVVLRWKFELGLFESPYVETVPDELDTVEDRALARRAASESIVLLQNPGILPIAATSVAVIGPNADRPLGMLGNYSYPVLASIVARLETAFDPTLAPNEGAGGLRLRRLSADESEPVPYMTHVVTVREALETRGLDVRYARGCGLQDTDTSDITQAVDAARHAQVAIVCVGDQSGLATASTVGEGVDSITCELPGIQRRLIEDVVRTGTPTVVVLINGRPFAMEWMRDLPVAIVEAWFPGEEGGNAVADVLFGDVNPSGKLPVSFPRHAGSIPCHYQAPSGASYYDGPSTPVFAFGHGLSYTTFEYADIVVDPNESTFEISCTVTNTGDRRGAEVVQLYLRDPVARTARPPLELKGFARVDLAAGDSKRVIFEVHEDRVAIYDSAEGWVVEPGLIEVAVGASSADLRLTAAFTIDGDVRHVGAGRVLTTPVRIES